MTIQQTRRTFLRGAAATAAAASALPLIGAPSSVFAAPNLIQTPVNRVEVVYWTTNASGTEAEAEETLTAAFEEANPEIKITRVLQTTYEATAASLIAALQTGDEPHLTILSDVWWFRFYLAEALADLNPLLSAANVDTDTMCSRSTSSTSATAVSTRCRTAARRRCSTSTATR